MKKLIAIIAILALGASCDNQEEVSPVEAPVSENTEGNQGTIEKDKYKGD